MYLTQPSFFIFELCDYNSTSFQKGSHCAVWCLSGGGRLTFIYHRSFMLCCKLQLVPVLGRALDRAQSLKLGSICLAQFTLPHNAPQSFLIKKNKKTLLLENIIIYLSSIVHKKSEKMNQNRANCIKVEQNADIFRWVKVLIRHWS